MLLIAIGVLLIIIGVVTAATATMRRGRLSEDHHQPGSHAPRDTLEPSGQGRRLGLKADIPGFALIAVGVVLIFLGSS